MIDEYLSIDGTEIFNAARATAYLEKFLPQIDVRCTSAAMGPALGHAPYVSPAADNAPWFRAGRPASGRFLGLFPGKIQGADNSTRTVEVTNLSGDGAVLTSPRYGVKEIRVVATAIALDAEAMNEGLAWLRDVTANDGCSDADLGCTGRTVRLFAAVPLSAADVTAYTRNFHKAEVTDPLEVTKRFAVKNFVMWQVEFTLTAGIPWAFTALSAAGTLDLDTGTNFTDPAGEDCGASTSAYDEFVADPYFTAISRPPRPPVILPPNILNINSWRRKSLAIPAVQSQRPGRVAPVVHVVTEGAAAQYLRLRFYRSGKVGCDFDGEFLISYLPANSTLTLNGITREATMVTGGRTVPAGHLLFGSDGTPFLWPTLGCQHTYTMTADLMPGQSGVAVVLDTAVRE